MTTVTSLRQGDETRSVVAAEIRALMGRHNVKQIDIAALLHISQPGVSQRLRGAAPFDIDEVATLAAYFGVSVGSLFGEDTVRRPDGPQGGPASAGMPNSSRSLAPSTSSYAGSLRLADLADAA
jgi:transcriptional regulator with XRE-family HTH domain